MIILLADGGFDAFGGGQDAFVDDFGGGGVDFSAEQVGVIIQIHICHYSVRQKIIQYHS